MTVGELIKQLSQFDPEARAMVRGYEGDELEVTRLSEGHWTRVENQSWYYGDYKRMGAYGSPNAYEASYFPGIEIIGGAE